MTLVVAPATIRRALGGASDRERRHHGERRKIREAEARLLAASMRNGGAAGGAGDAGAGAEPRSSLALELQSRVRSQMFRSLISPQRMAAQETQPRPSKTNLNGNTVGYKSTADSRTSCTNRARGRLATGRTQSHRPGCSSAPVCAS